MIKAELGKHVAIAVDNQVGALSEAARILADNSINLIAICAYVLDKKGFILFVTSEAEKTAAILRSKKYDVKEEEVVILTVDNKPGALQKISEKIARAGIDLRLIYGSAEDNSKKSRIILLSENNRAAIAAIEGS